MTGSIAARIPHTVNLFKRCVSYLANVFYKYWIVELDIQKIVREGNEPFLKLKVMCSWQESLSVSDDTAKKDTLH